jgi:hypothetical protein
MTQKQAIAIVDADPLAVSDAALDRALTWLAANYSIEREEQDTLDGEWTEYLHAI